VTRPQLCSNKIVEIAEVTEVAKVVAVAEITNGTKVAKVMDQENLAALNELTKAVEFAKMWV
jgi:hypothetical protein